MLEFARRQPSAILLAAQVAGLLLYPFMEGRDVGRPLFSVFGISVGLSDVTPVKPFARGLVMLEQFAGVAYVAMLVSRVVGLTVMRRRA